MKIKISLLALALGLITFNSADAQVQNNAVKLNPLGAIFGNLGLGFEHALNDKSSVQLNIGILSKTIDFGSSVFGGGFGYELKYTGFQISPEYRMYFDESMHKWYGGAFLNYNSVKQTQTWADGGDENNTETKLTNIGGGVEFGNQWLLGSNENFVIDLNLGVGYQTVSSDTESDDDGSIEFNLAADGVYPKMSFAVGYAF